MSRNRITLIQIAGNAAITILICSLVVWKMPSGNKVGWDNSVVVLSLLINIVIVHRAREARRSAEQ